MTLSIAEVDRLISTAEARISGTVGREHLRAVRLHALIEVLYATGLRASEVVTLPRTVLSGDGRVLTVKGKGGRERMVPLNTAARSALERLLRLGGDRRRGIVAADRDALAVSLPRRRWPPYTATTRPGTEGARRSRAHRS